MYPFHHPQVYLFHVFPVVERDSVNVIFDIDLLSHMRDIVDDYVVSDAVAHHHHDNEPVMVIELDLSMLTMNLNVVRERKFVLRSPQPVAHCFRLNFLFCAFIFTRFFSFLKHNFLDFFCYVRFCRVLFIFHKMIAAMNGDLVR